MFVLCSLVMSTWRWAHGRGWDKMIQCGVRKYAEQMYRLQKGFVHPTSPFNYILEEEERNPTTSSLFHRQLCYFSKPLMDTARPWWHDSNCKQHVWVQIIIQFLAWKFFDTYGHNFIVIFSCFMASIGPIIIIIVFFFFTGRWELGALFQFYSFPRQDP